jgi:hypothetical protein
MCIVGSAGAEEGSIAVEPGINPFAEFAMGVKTGLLESGDRCGSQAAEGGGSDSPGAHIWIGNQCD